MNYVELNLKAHFLALLVKKVINHQQIQTIKL